MGTNTLLRVGAGGKYTAKCIILVGVLISGESLVNYVDNVATKSKFLNHTLGVGSFFD